MEYSDTLGLLDSLSKFGPVFLLPSAPFWWVSKMPPNSSLSQIYDLIDNVSLIMFDKYSDMYIYVYNGNKIRHINQQRRGAPSRMAT